MSHQSSHINNINKSEMADNYGRTNHENDLNSKNYRKTRKPCYRRENNAMPL